MVQINSIVPSPGNLPTSASSPSVAGGAPAGGVTFEQLMSRLLVEADQPQQVVTQDMNNLLRGEVDNIHDVAINAAKADIAFRIVMEVRDKLISAYQDVMRMQV